MSAVNISQRSLGVNFRDGRAEVLVWAPEAQSLALRVHKKEDLLFTEQEKGYWRLTTTGLQAGDRYTLVIDKDKAYPDPCSLSQPEGVHKASRALDLEQYAWSDASWKNIPLRDYIIYELHIGTFTQEGNFEAAAEKLDHLVELGITAVELMPVASFPGRRNWGYDGVLLYAVQESYGGAEGLQRFVDLCHSKGLAVILDVVYNHFGPEGNYMEQFGPYLTDHYSTPWGKAVNYDAAHSDEVRRFFIENALMWLRDFHVDALRLDAVHAIRDFSAHPFLRELKEHVEALSEQLEKPCYLVIECDLNDPRFIDPPERNGFGLDAQWSDEFHHALRVSAGQSREGYYADFNGIADLAKAYSQAYVYDGQYSQQRQRRFGAKAERFTGKRFVVFSQNHDQVGNRMLGERSSMLVSPEMQKLMVAAVMVSPYLPLLFMGEEWGETHPFLYFADHSEPELIEAVREGRKKEFREFHKGETVPDPMDERTFKRSKLQWDLLDSPAHHDLFAYYKELIALRKNYFSASKMPRVNLLARTDEHKNVLILERWSKNMHLICLMNFSARARFATLPGTFKWRKLIYSAESRWRGPLDDLSQVPSGKFTLAPESCFICYAHV